MAQQPYYTANRNELKRRDVIPPDTLLTKDNFRILLSKETFIDVANRVGTTLGFKLTQTQVKEIMDLAARLPPSKFIGLNLSDARSKLANEYLQRGQDYREQYDETQTIRVLADLDDMGDGTMESYNKKELFQLTDNENQYKITTFANRRGNAILDKDRVDGIRSSPNNLESGKKISKDEYFRQILKTMNLINTFLAAESIDNMFKQFNQNTLTFNNVSLPHQIVQLDSRNRLLTSGNTNQYKWNLNWAGQPGHLGDVRIWDTLQQIVSMKINSFWIPMLGNLGGYYGKVRMLIREFIGQSTIVTEFLDATQNVPTVEYYHFEFNVTQVVGNRVFLEPENGGLYIFRKPFARPETITISFRTPFETMVLALDRGVYTVTFGNPTLFTLTSPGVTNNFLATGDLVYVTGLDTVNDTIDDQVNNPAGNIITFVSPTQFTIAVDSSALVGSETDINVYYGSKRIFFQLEFTSLEQG